MSYQVVTRLTPDDTPLAVVPSSIWVISTLEIAIEQGGRTVTLLTYPSYPLLAQRVTDDHDEGYWAPPFMAYPVPILYSPPALVGSVRRIVNEALKHIDITQDLQQLCYQMGLRDVDLEEREPFLELKVSPRSPELLKAYWILRHGLRSADAACLRNLADSEVRRGYVYGPTDLSSRHYSTRPSDTHGRHEVWLLGKPLQSNVEHVLRNEETRLALESARLRLDAEMFTRSESGLVCVVDLSGYGRALKYAHTQMRSFTETSERVQTGLRIAVSEYLQDMLAALGATQAQIAGDGLVAAFPDRVFKDRNATIRKILAEWSRVTAAIDNLNASIAKPEFRMGSRMALHAGDYSYGRTGGVGSFLPAFDGQSVVDAVRLEQGLASSDLAKDVRHRLAVSTALSAFRPVIRSAGWVHRGTTNLSAKEHVGRAAIYSGDGIATPEGPQ
jgi:hypothetical protein